ncbi:hypothetical protein N3K66_000109 [Trichothecium roseum]|uniref:Uncharacterized protein n=1 Tax=Trichothecium roseum TaxID=47278 RepID=A0ACC0VAX6_9HYPO|nr:hypothetical protein N3K66_000109 [Trichothecium roseum]
MGPWLTCRLAACLVAPILKPPLVLWTVVRGPSCRPAVVQNRQGVNQFGATASCCSNLESWGSGIGWQNGSYSALLRLSWEETGKEANSESSSLIRNSSRLPACVMEYYVAQQLVDIPCKKHEPS